MRDEDPASDRVSRRAFLRTSAAAGLPLVPRVAAARGAGGADAGGPDVASQASVEAALPADVAADLGLDLAPARWVWYPSGRTLANTFVLFRRDVSLSAAPRRVTGWVAADSRYLLAVNGTRVQWGPAPCDPRWLEADPVDLTALLRAGANTIAVTVLHYGHGDGTWPTGKPGLIARLEIERADGVIETLVTDDRWRCHLSRAWPPGHYKRWFLRALQEEFDARLHPHGWDRPGFAAGDGWVAASPLDCPADQPPICSTYSDYATDASGKPRHSGLRRRSIPMLEERLVPAARLRESYWITWRRPAEDYFDCVVPDAFDAQSASDVAEVAEPGAWSVRLDGRRAAALTFEFTDQVVGWPAFTIEAPAGTVVEWLVQEAHQPGGPPLLNTHFHAWGRLTCREGTNAFEAFDFESLRWLQLHVRGGAGRVTIRDVGVRRRQFPWPSPAFAVVAEPPLLRLLDACINTLHNSAQETCVDGMGRERQQYSGDGGHQLHAVYSVFGETRLPGRFVRTFSQGLMESGFFLDSWPAYDRLARLSQREMGLTGWGPILDHGVGFVFDSFHHWMYTGRLDEVAEAYPRLLRFVEYLLSFRREGLLGVEQIGLPTVWLDHQAYRAPREKQLAFNLYASAMLTHALAPLAEALADARSARHARLAGSGLLRSAVARFWSSSHGVFVNNWPWVTPGDVRLCDRSLATALLFGQCPGGRTEASIDALASQPANMGLSYPANAAWRFWALAKAGRTDVIVDEWRRRWATMPSVIENNTVQENWEARPDSGAQWSHCAVAPLYALHMCLAGIRPTAPGFSRYEIRPQPADLESIALISRTVRGPIVVETRGGKGARQLRLQVPDGGGVLVLDHREQVTLREVGTRTGRLRRYEIPAGGDIRVELRYT